jgi:hypothetical protein
MAVPLGVGQAVTRREYLDHAGFVAGSTLLVGGLVYIERRGSLRRSFDNFLDRRAAHMLSAFASDTALVLAHLDCDEKPNEIPAVRTLLGSFALSDAVVTVDAMHCQKKAFEHAAASSVHLIAQAKANQPTLHHTIAELCNTTLTLDLGSIIQDGGHGAEHSLDRGRVKLSQNTADCRVGWCFPPLHAERIACWAR